MSQILSTPTAQVAFPADTADTPWTFVVTGTNADGSAFSLSHDNSAASLQADLPVGTGFVLVVSKNGISSLPSDSFDVSVPTTVMLTVPDAAQKATITTI